MTVDGGPPGDHESEPADRTGERNPREESETGTESTEPEDESVDREALQTAVRSLDSRVRWQWCLRATIVAAVVGTIIGAISVFGLEWGPLPGVGAFLLALLIGVSHALALYRTWEYRVREDALYLQRGVITHVKTVVPFVRVQHIDTSRGPIDRLLGLSSLVVYTAGSRGADVTVPGLTQSDAADLQERLKVLAKDSNGDDAV
ncbi:PH domain-containing protein [Halorhabdus sp. BNX81]|uniref:PH domain-containing protein n=1 Tax=Halorhabdus sp. BNX81 TaxID=2980181 RepID=UPI0023DD33CD|nr:PH domain-containing protein [Halorhabdus sp. BNX81]WEL21276.1 putative membrane protein YdbS, contains bPH2 domain [Halorhabdus sp. BNX81]